MNLAQALGVCQYCRKCFYFYQQGFMALLSEEEGGDQPHSSEDAESKTTERSTPRATETTANRNLVRASERALQGNAKHPEDTLEEVGSSGGSGGVREGTMTGSAERGSAVSSGGDYIDCRDVVLFSRILRMIDASSNSLRQQLVNDESELEKSDQIVHFFFCSLFELKIVVLKYVCPFLLSYLALLLAVLLKAEEFYIEYRTSLLALNRYGVFSHHEDSR